MLPVRFRTRSSPIVAHAALLVLVLLASCAALPERPVLDVSERFADPQQTTLGQLVHAAWQRAPGLTGVWVLDSGHAAFLERVALVEAAERSIDAQYYIWNSDRTGRYLASRIYAAAERGVRVRLLVDDINVAGRDAVMAALDAHRNIELRIYNPFATRTGMRKSLGFVSEWARLNRRMHNKSLTVDGAVAIVGGRNIGDEYFDASPEFNFSDRDVAAVGEVVSSVGTMFDKFWNSTLTYPVSLLAEDRLSPGTLDTLLAGTAASASELEGLGFSLPVGASAGMAAFRQSLAGAVWAPVSLVHDAPPGTNDMGASDTLQSTARVFAGLAGETREELLIESAYLVLDDQSLEAFRRLIDNGVHVVAETNSLASNDVTANHAAYARRRRAILLSGMELYELKPDAAACALLVAIGCDAERNLGLHAKTFVFDRRKVWVGSFNLNLRSAYLNAEAGMIIDSPALAASIAAAIMDSTRPENSWRVRLDDGRVRWSSKEGESFSHEPETSWVRRMIVSMIASLPVEKYL